MNAYTVVRDSDRLPLGFATSESEASAVALMMGQALGEKVHIEIRDAEELIAEQANRYRNSPEPCLNCSRNCFCDECDEDEEDSDLDIDEDEDEEITKEAVEKLAQRILKAFGLN